jgi:hypothetical protein
MPFDSNNNYYLEDVHYKMNVTPQMYARCKKHCEDQLMTQSSFEGMIRLFEDLGISAQLKIMKELE